VCELRCRHGGKSRDVGWRKDGAPCCPKKVHDRPAGHGNVDMSNGSDGGTRLYWPSFGCNNHQRHTRRQVLLAAPSDHGNGKRARLFARVRKQQNNCDTFLVAVELSPPFPHPSPHRLFRIYFIITILPSAIDKNTHRWG
jgi:hypothetical protein